MPTYEYECDKCRRVFEIRQRISEPALTTCDACGGAVRRLLSPAPFILKGDGWYVTDYPSESRKKAMDSEKKDGASTAATAEKTASKGDAKTESKGDAKIESKTESKSQRPGASPADTSPVSAPAPVPRDAPAT